ncbi:MAG TPA: FAD-dependent oxidoreductase, partial [Reyranella sp.]|nr:FAD-dependent oxidoreductase [Reyranella sp.]
MSPPVQPVASDEKLPSSVDVVVIGAGIAGTTAAYELAKRDLSVALLDKGRVGGEQSSRNWGWVRQQHRDLRELPLAMRSLEIWRGLNQEIGAETGFRPTGLLYVTTRPADFAQWEAWTLKAREYQMHSRILSAAEAKELTPGSVPAWIGGVHSPTDGRGEPSLASPAIAEAARRAGATIHQDCAARGLETLTGKVSGVIT